MASVRETFSLSGPLHLTDVNCLVKGAYTLECDRQHDRKGNDALAPPWWEFFQFRLVRPLVDDADLSISGAIFEFKNAIPNSINPHHNPPKYVIAFRGTIVTARTRLQDIRLNLQAVRNRLDQTFRFQVAMEVVEHIVSISGPEKVWLAGHSLGSAIALQAGKNMVRMGFPLETYLFNLPFLSIPLDRIKSETIKNGLRFASNVIKAGVAVAVTDHNQRVKSKESFAALSGWIPNMFLNPSDPICSEYIGYFENRVKMMEMGASKIATIAMHNSLGSLLSWSKDFEPLHLLPSGYLTINLGTSEDYKEAHGINQWWKPDICCIFKLHQLD